MTRNMWGKTQWQGICEVRLMTRNMWGKTQWQGICEVRLNDKEYVR